jgi:hypothetical protein
MIVVESWEVYITSLFMGMIVKTGWPWWQLRRIRVERDPALCELLNRDIGDICGWPNFENKSYVSLCLL